MVFEDGSMTLDSVADEYLISRQIRNKKYLPHYINAAKWAWKKLFKNTMWSVQSEWQPLRQGDPYNYVNVPVGMQRLFSVSITDHCGNIVPLYYNSKVNILPKPKVNSCGCTACICNGGLCDDISSLTKISKLLFTINGVNYYEVDWLKVCPNGDIIEFKQVPTKKYNNLIGDGGDFNADYNNDYLIANPPFTDYTIVTETFQQVLCKIDVKPCGCPENTVANEELFMQHCGGFCQPFAHCIVNHKRKHCKRVIEDTNYDTCLGSVKMSECGTRIYYVPRGTLPGQPPAKMPDYLLINFQTSGENCNTTVVVPEYAIDTMFYGIDHNSKRFSGVLFFKEKLAVKYSWVDAQNDLILYLNPFSLERLASIQDEPILF